MVRFQRDTTLSGIRTELTRPEVLVLCPALCLAWLWFGLEGVLLFAATGTPLAWLARRPSPPAPQPGSMIDVVTGLPPVEAVREALDQCFFVEEETGRSTACAVVGLDDPQRIRTAFGQSAHEAVLRKVAERLRGALRDDDILARADGECFAIAIAPGRRMDLESTIQIAARLKAAVAEPLSIDATAIYVSASVGFCLSGRAPNRSGKSLVAAAEAALMSAQRNGPGTIRAYSPEIATATAAHDALQQRVESALETGEIVAYFQPQLSTDTGEVSGFEALARWQHPQRGVLSPPDFLPAILDNGLGERLSEVMLSHAMSALRQWDAAGLDVPCVAVNFSRDELRDPSLVSKLKWQLDRFNLTPDRLTIEILETVAAETADDIIVRNIAALSKMGCPVDLDDFGTGHASIASIRRFAVNRIKIDRSYVTQVDTDPSQQRMVAAVLSMADRLGLQTLAEGVETIGEHAMLSQLGCSHVQGYVIARPMPIQATGDWLRKHRSKLHDRPNVGRHAG